MKRNTTLTAVAVCASAIVGLAALGSAPASADPTPATPFRVLTAMGSDTTQDVMNGFAAAVTASGTDYRNSGLLQAAAAIGDTSIKTSILPVAGEVLTIGTGAGAENVTVSSVTTAASANTLAAAPGNAVAFNTVAVSALTKAHPALDIVVGNFVAAGTKVIASYDAQGGAVQTKANANCQYIANNGGTTGTAYTGTTQSGSVQAGTLANSGFLAGGRANGSGPGASTLGESYTPSSPTFGCVDVGRASSKRSNVTGLGLGNAVNIPFAIDAVDFAVTTTSNFSRKLSFTQLNAIYRCTFGGMIPNNAVIPAGTSTQAFAASTGQLYATVPQAGSGTRGFVLGALGLTDTPASNAQGSVGAACITDKTPTGGVLEEHNLISLDDNGIGVTSIAQSIAQRASAITGVTDKQGRTVLVAIDNTAAANGGTAHGDGKLSYATAMTNLFTGGTGNTPGALQMWRDVFNVVPLNRLADPNIQAAFVGAGSSVCTDATGVLSAYGFAKNPNCGITTNVG